MPLSNPSSNPNAGLFGLAPTGTLSENFSRYYGTTGVAGTSGTLRMVAIYIPSNTIVTSLNVASGSTGEAGGTHAWGALFDSSRNLLRQSPDETGATAIAGSVAHAFTLTSTFTTTYSGLYYVGVNVVATTMPNLVAASGVNQFIAQLTPIIYGNTTDTALTTTAPSIAGAITATGNPFYCYIK